MLVTGGKDKVLTVILSGVLDAHDSLPTKNLSLKHYMLFLQNCLHDWILVGLADCYVVCI